MNKNVVENTKETVNFPVYMLLSKDLPKDVAKKVQWYGFFQKMSSEGFNAQMLPADVNFFHNLLSEYQLKQQDLESQWSESTKNKVLELQQDLQTDIDKSLEDTGIKTEAKKFNSTGSVIERVPIELKLGDVIFSLYTQNDSPLKAPLARALQHEKHIEIAKTLNKERFSVPDEAFEIVRECLLDEEKWDSMIVYGAFCAPETGETHHIPFKTKALSAYKQIMSGLLLAFMPKKEPVENQTQVNDIEQQ